MDYFTTYNNMTMRKIIYLVMRITKFTAVPEKAFKSKKNAESYLKEKEMYDKNYHGVVFSVYMEDID